jgi:hypothetical protein
MKGIMRSLETEAEKKARIVSDPEATYLEMERMRREIIVERIMVDHYEGLSKLWNAVAVKYLKKLERYENG